MTDHIARNREEYRDHWWDEGREEEDKRQERKKFQNNTEDGIIHEWIDRNILHHEHHDEYNRLERYHEEHDERETDEFSENNTGSMDRLREHKVDGTSFDLSGDHPPSEEEDDGKSRQFDEWEPEVIENSPQFPECKRLECKGDQDEDHTKKENEREKLISHKFSDGVESDSEHRREQSLSIESREWYCIILRGRTVGIFGQMNLNAVWWVQRMLSKYQLYYGVILSLRRIHFL